jgi:lipid-binding SYLF domain-containing protein
MKNLLAQTILVVLAVVSTVAQADSAAEIDRNADATLATFKRTVGGGEAYLEASKAALIFSSIVKGGFIFGGEYGEGALRVRGKTVEYWSTSGASFGLQIGVQEKSMVLLFMQDSALEKFRNGSGFEVGVDGNIALIDAGASATANTTNLKDPIVAFVFGNKGLMVDVSLNGSKFSTLDK